jgi:type III pantothenate kinase
MRALIVDVGNSAVAVGLGEEMEAGVQIRARFSLATPRDGDGCAELTRRLAAEAAIVRADRLVLVSVVPAVDAAVAATGLEVATVDHRTPLPYRNGVRDAAAVGADRYCNVAAAVGAGWRDALVVDAGTATTFDLLRDGEFVGGLIAPGMAFAARELGATAARLRPVPFAPCPLEAGRDTAAAMQAGAFHAGVGGAVAVIEGLLARYGSRPVVITGGLAAHLQGPGWRHDPLWTLRGAALLAGLGVS